MFETLTLEFTGQLATLTFNRPEKRNAISQRMVSEIQSALDEVETSHARVAIITGAGKSFCAGMDLEMLSEIATQSSSDNMEDSRRMAKMFRRIWSAGPAGSSVTLTLSRRGEASKVQIRSADRSDFLKKPRLH